MYHVLEASGSDVRDNRGGPGFQAGPSINYFWLADAA